jgi:hypothetical protein
MELMASASTQDSAVERALRTFDGVVLPVDPAGRCTYFQDRNRRWPFHTNALGADLLHQLVAVAAKLVAVSDAQLAAVADAERLRREGESIYARKPNKKSEDVTWSQEEYRHAGLQREYVRFKSVQRFTETWAALERAHALGALEAAVSAHARGGGACRVASLGGGPGFELFACERFFARHFASVKLECVSLDLAPEWGAYCGALGVGFGVWDVCDGAGLLAKAGGPVDFALISYVLHHYMANQPCADWLGQWLNGPQPAAELAGGLELLAAGPTALGEAPVPRALIVCGRDEHLGRERELLGRARVDVLALIDQSRGRDDRQVLLRGAGAPPCRAGPGLPRAELTFENVPFEEHKRGGGGGGGYGGRGGGHGGGGGNRGGRHSGDGGGGYRGGYGGDGGGGNYGGGGRDVGGYKRPAPDCGADGGHAASRPRQDQPPQPPPPDPDELARQRAARLQAARDKQAELLAQREREERK